MPVKSPTNRRLRRPKSSREIPPIAGGAAPAGRPALRAELGRAKADRETEERPAKEEAGKGKAHEEETEAVRRSIIDATLGAAPPANWKRCRRRTKRRLTGSQRRRRDGGTGTGSFCAQHWAPTEGWSGRSGKRCLSPFSFPGCVCSLRFCRSPRRGSNPTAHGQRPWEDGSVSHVSRPNGPLLAGARRGVRRIRVTARWAFCRVRGRPRTRSVAPGFRIAPRRGDIAPRVAERDGIARPREGDRGFTGHPLTQMVGRPSATAWLSLREEICPGLPLGVLFSGLGMLPVRGLRFRGAVGQHFRLLGNFDQETGGG